MRRELSDALERQAATDEVLRVISSSPDELEPVFSAMLENALRICEAKFGMLMRYSDGTFVAQTMVRAPLASQGRRCCRSIKLGNHNSSRKWRRV